MISPYEKFMAEDRVWRERVELWSWTPLRCHSMSRIKPIPVVGITNHDAVDDVYYCIAELDDHRPLYQVLNRCQKLGLKHAMIFKTKKGYHFYFFNNYKNPQKCVKLLRSAGFDRKHLSLFKTREDKTLVLRVSRKYREPDIYPVYVSMKVLEEAWLREVLHAITFLHWKGMECKFLSMVDSALDMEVKV